MYQAKVSSKPQNIRHWQILNYQTMTCAKNHFPVSRYVLPKQANHVNGSLK